MKMFISFVVCMIIVPGIMLVHLYGALTHNYWAAFGVIPVAIAIHYFYPLSKIDEAFAESKS